jgi:hypothetical protein
LRAFSLLFYSNLLLHFVDTCLAKVGNPEREMAALFLLHQKVRRLDIPVHHANFMNRCETLEKHSHELSDLTHREWPVHDLANKFLHVEVAERVHDVDVGLSDKDLVYSYDVRVFQSLESFDFSEELLGKTFLSLANFHFFQSDEGVSFLVDSFEDLRKSAFADLI